jgi:hypothetical protein
MVSWLCQKKEKHDRGLEGAIQVRGEQNKAYLRTHEDAVDVLVEPDCNEDSGGEARGI